MPCNPKLRRLSMDFLHDVLAELSKDAEPVAWGNFKDDGTPCLLSISQHPEDRANWMNPVRMTDTGEVRYQTCKVCGAKDCDCTMGDWVTKLQTENAALKEQVADLALNAFNQNQAFARWHSKIATAVDALEKLRNGHLFNARLLSTTEVHAICFEALAAIGEK